MERPASARGQERGDLWPGAASSRDLRLALVRNILRILGYHERDDTTQKSVGEAKFTFAEGCITRGSLGGMHTGQEVRRGFI
jgi:hypothetical protein